MAREGGLVERLRVAQRDPKRLDVREQFYLFYALKFIHLYTINAFCYCYCVLLRRFHLFVIGAMMFFGAGIWEVL